MDLEKLVAIGCQLGMTGAELKKWVAQKEKEEAEKQRQEAEKAEKEREKEFQRQLQLLREETEKIREETERIRQAAREEAERAAERERKKEFQRQLQLLREETEKIREETERIRQAAREKAERAEREREIQLERERAEREREREEKARKHELEILKIRLGIRSFETDSSSAAESTGGENGGPSLCPNPEEVKGGQGIPGHVEVDDFVSSEKTARDLRISALRKQGDEIPPVAISTSGLNVLDKSVPTSAKGLSGEIVAVSCQNSNSPVAVLEDPVREELTGQISPVRPVDGSFSKSSKTQIGAENPGRSGTALRKENSPCITLGDHPQPAAAQAKRPLRVAKEDQVIGEPRSNFSEGEGLVPVMMRAPAKAKPLRYPRSKAPGPTTEPPRKRSTKKGPDRNKLSTTGIPRRGKQLSCQKGRFKREPKRERERSYPHFATTKKRRSRSGRRPTAQGKARHLLVADHSHAKRKVCSSDITSGVRWLVAPRVLRTRLPPPELRFRPIDTG